MRQIILSSLEKDFSLDGIKKVWRYIPEFSSIPETLYPSISINYGTETARINDEGIELYDVAVILIIYIMAKADTNNQGLLRAEAEKWIEKYKNVNYVELQNVENVIAFEYKSSSPYLNIGLENKGFVVMEYNLTYIGG